MLGSGATNYMTNKREMFIDIDDSFSGKVQTQTKQSLRFVDEVQLHF